MYPTPPPYPMRSANQVALSWVPAEHGHIPQHAVPAGPNIFVARAVHAGELIPGKAARGHQTVYVPYGGKENPVSKYEVLCDTSVHFIGCGYSWQPCSGVAAVPSSAIVGGYTAKNEPYYIARADMNGEAIVGKVYMPHGCAYFPWGGQEHSRQQFQILVFQ